MPRREGAGGALARDGGGGCTACSSDPVSSISCITSVPGRSFSGFDATGMMGSSEVETFTGMGGGCEMRSGSGFGTMIAPRATDGNAVDSSAT